MIVLDTLNTEEQNHKQGAPRGQKRPFRPREVWAIRARLEMLGEIRNLALLNLAIDSKLRGCDLVRLKVSDVFSAGSVRERAMVIQKKTSRPVQFEITKLTATSLVTHVQKSNLSKLDFLFPSRNGCSAHLSTRQYHRIVDKWVEQIGLKVSGLWNAFASSHKGCSIVPKYWQPSCCSVVARTRKDRKHNSLSWH